MALLDNPLDLDPDQPSTHAFVIGVGTYQFLRGGEEQNTNLNLGLGQLSSPPHSALRFIRWLLEDFHNDAAPLASVEHLISSPHQVSDREGSLHDSEEPTFENIERAYKKWIDRAGANPDNVALFYFCGHGVSKGVETGLLTADFGDPGIARPTSRSIHVEETVKGMLACKAEKQCFFIDSCRSVDETLLDMMSSPGDPLGTASSSDVSAIPQPVIFASSLTERALGQENSPSVFTECLIDALDGMAADDKHGSFEIGKAVVDTELLCRAIKSALEILALDKPWLAGATATFGGGGSFELHFPKKPVKIPLIVNCSPDALNASATLEIRHNQQTLDTRPPERAPWVTRQAPDRYDYGGSLIDGRTAENSVLLYPPKKLGQLIFPDLPSSNT